MENLKRYDLQVNIGGGGQMVPCYEGEFVKFSDITEALKVSHNSAMDAIAIIDSAISGGWFDFDRTKGYDALVAVRQLLQQHQSRERWLKCF